ncbi:MAG: RNA polymerase sigma-54 factor [Phycisphaerae bacterium]|nr:RNA polymerase sigma-54 factor [Phycisphaerae bacterium]
MRFDASQHQRLGQVQKLTPSMIQHMQVLQLPLAELEATLEEQFESNFMLEQVEPEAPEPTQPKADADQPPRDDEAGFDRLAESERTMPEATDNLYESRPKAKSDQDRDGKIDAMANAEGRPQSIEEQLLDQWREAEVSSEIATLGVRVIEHLAPDGFFRHDVDELAATLGSGSNRLQEALDAVQSWLDPPGIAARSYPECYAIQIKRRELEDPSEDVGHWTLLLDLLANDWDDLLNNRLKKISEQRDCSIAEIEASRDLLGQLKKQPVRTLDNERPSIVRPEIAIERDESGVISARSLKNRFPKFRLNPEYEAILKTGGLNDTDSDQFRKARDEARQLLEAIEQRHRTVERVANAIVARQQSFFTEGDGSLVPLMMEEIAEQLDISVSTVSRAVDDKWAETPRGMLCLRDFFVGGLVDREGRPVAYETVKKKVQALVDAEDRRRPLSDAAIEKALQEEGIDIKRRTVAKYREELSIPNSELRKRHSD